MVGPNIGDLNRGPRQCSLGGHERRPHESNRSVFFRGLGRSAHTQQYDRANTLATAQFFVFLSLRNISAVYVLSSNIEQQIAFFLTQTNDATFSLTVGSQTL